MKQALTPSLPHYCTFSYPWPLSPSRTSLPSLPLLLFQSLLCCFFRHLQIQFFSHPHVSRLPAASSFCGSPELRSHWVRWRDEHLSFPLLTLPCPASRLPARGGDWDAVDDAAAGSSFALITPREPTMVWFGFLQPGLIFHISDVNAPQTLPPTLLIKFAPYAFEGRWTDWRACFSLTPLPGASGLIRPQPWWGQALQSWDSIMFPKIAWLEIMKAYDFLEQRSHPEEETGTWLRACSLDRYYQINFQR